MKRIYSTLLLLVFLSISHAQDSISFEMLAEYEFPSSQFLAPSTFSSQIDTEGREYIYTANKHAGVITFSISSLTQPTPIDTLSVNDFETLMPTAVEQKGDILYVTLGEFVGFTTQNAGLAIVNIADPEEPIIMGQWDSIAYEKGCPISLVTDGYAYLAAMERGIIILDVSDPADIRFVSQITLDRLFPKVPGIASEPHARGLDLVGDKLYVAHDAGGLRIVDVSDKSNPIEETKYVNDSMFQTTQVAYNKVVVNGDKAYISTDYCGMEMLEISTTNAIPQGEWYNPFDCMPSNWIGAEGHTNGVKILEEEDLLFMSAGDTEVLVYDISDVNEVKEIGRYGILNDSTIAWSLDVKDDLIVLSCVDNPNIPLQPYFGEFGGIILLKWKREVSDLIEISSAKSFFIYPNPTNNYIHIKKNNSFLSDVRINIIDQMGRQIFQTTMVDNIDVTNFESGVYYIQMISNSRMETQSFIKH